MAVNRDMLLGIKRFDPNIKKIEKCIDEAILSESKSYPGTSAFSIPISEAVLTGEMMEVLEKAYTDNGWKVSWCMPYMPRPDGNSFIFLTEPR